MSQTTATQNLTDVLNKQISNWSVLYIKLHNYHWFVSGENFYELHEKYEEFYTAAAEYIDDLAERLLAINGKPVATMRDFLQHATITEATGNETPKQMVETIYNDFQTIIEELKQGIGVAENHKDEPTADMLIDIRGNIEKHAWMLKAFLNK
ncbi:Dps family protein [Bacillus horti]|uniref:Starvation-inducible DNA-binding protein n=1 Tax=Caldalkalibacillus horti TaxID=77523 RepID=A0ABT9W5Y1_9BACI|nr:DNA starvation/stationary phase protection protein [Bacillus horti]MDQ0168469.1 starvation-inducible DNA-binding protein [Bacillus horti]